MPFGEGADSVAGIRPTTLASVRTREKQRANPAGTAAEHTATSVFGVAGKVGAGCASTTSVLAERHTAIKATMTPRRNPWTPNSRGRNFTACAGVLGTLVHQISTRV